MAIKRTAPGPVSRRRFVAGTLMGGAGVAAAFPASAQAATVDVNNPGVDQSPVWNGSAWLPGSFPDLADYQAVVSGSGIGLINTRTGNTDYSTSSGDHAAVVQQAVNALHTANNGGLISFLSPGPARFQSQLTIYPGIFLEGRGPLSSQQTGGRPTIVSTYNGSCILVTGDGSTIAFCGIRDMTIIGSRSASAQNGIEWNTSGGGNIQDTFLERVSLFNMGLDGYLISGPHTKVWINQCYCELAGRHAINQNAASSNLYLTECYLVLNNGNGYQGNAASLLQAVNCHFGSNSGQGLALAGAGAGNNIGNCYIGNNAQQGILLPPSNAHLIHGNIIENNGGSSYPAVEVDSMSGPLSLVANVFYEGRSSPNNTVSFIVGASAGQVNALVQANQFNGATQGPRISMTSRSGNRLIVKSNLGWNDTLGKIATPFASSGRIGPWGTTGTPSPSTDYKAEGPDLMLAVSGGSDVSINITDPTSNTVQSGLSAYTGVLPVGYSVNFGAFSSAPTVYVGIT